MTFEDFDELTERLMGEIRTMRDTKGKEYAGPRDRFDNFNRLSQRMGIDRKQVWQVYFTKHMDAIESYIREGQTFSTEGIQGRIIDAMTYLLLLAGMIEEDEAQEVERASSICTGVNGPATEPQLPYAQGDCPF